MGGDDGEETDGDGERPEKPEGERPEGDDDGEKPEGDGEKKGKKGDKKAKKEKPEELATDDATVALAQEGEDDEGEDDGEETDDEDGPKDCPLDDEEKEALRAKADEMGLDEGDIKKLKLEKKAKETKKELKDLGLDEKLEAGDMEIIVEEALF